MERGTVNNGKKRDRIGVVLYLAYLLMLLASVVLVVKVACTQLFFHPDEKIEAQLTPPVKKQVIDPVRGDILDSEGRLLAMTCPVYDIRMDCTVLKSNGKSDTQKAMNEQTWLAKARELAGELGKTFPSRTADQWYKLIKESRDAGKRYVIIANGVDHKTYSRLVDFPLWREGSYKGGLITERRFIRMYPYGTLARRTIGFVRSNKSDDVKNNHVGIEGRFGHELYGKPGVEYLRKTDHGSIRDYDSTYVRAEDGNDLRMTINIDYQDIADKALREQVEGREDLIGATLTLMEVSTGAIRAMVNLVYDPKTGKFEETQNMVVGRKIEPGSVFKTVTLMSVLNDGYVKSLDETLPATNGHVEGTNINDDHIPDFARNNNTKEISIIDGYKISSNYVFATLAVKHYGKSPRKYLDNVYAYKLGEAFDFDLEGLAQPTLPERKNDNLHVNDLGRLGFGYISEETPLHILTYYNAIANKGKMMKPYLVEDIEKNGLVLKKRGPSVLNSAICSKAVADTLNRALLAVTEDGTAKWSLRGVKCNVGGKTGTSFGTFPKEQQGKDGYHDMNGNRKYQSTFVGYFPAGADETPRYSFISTLYTRATGYSSDCQGGGIPARAVKTMINGIYNIDPYFQQTLAKSR